MCYTVPTYSSTHLRVFSSIVLGNVPDLARLERFLAAIGQQEDEIFRERISNEAEFQARQRKFAKRSNGRGGNGNGKAVETEAEQQLREMASANAFEEAMAAQVLYYIYRHVDRWLGMSISWSFH
jgi:5'-3' exonuclease